MTRRSTRHTWQDPRRVRRLAVLLQMPQHEAIEARCSAATLDRLAALDESQSPEDWQQALEAAQHYLQELGRTKP